MINYVRPIAYILVVTSLVSLGFSGDVLGSQFSYYDKNRLPNNYRQVQGNRVIIDRGFLLILAKNPRPDSKIFDQNANELVYLVSDGDREAIDLALRVIANTHAESVMSDNLKRPVRRVAWALSYQHLLLDVLGKQPQAVRSKVLHYFDVNPQDFMGVEGYMWFKKQLQGK